MNSNSNKIFICGSVDDGKSTLLGRILLDTDNLPTDQIEYLKNKSWNLAKITDGLKSEIQNDITVDVAYRYFKLKNRNFVFVDCPGHYEFTTNMISGASQCCSAIILIDVNIGPTEQTWRHINICNFLGIKRVIFAINKMDNIEYTQDKYESTIRELSKTTSDFNCTFIPVSAKFGDNVAQKSKNMSWYQGKSLIDKICSTTNDSEATKTDLLASAQIVIEDKTEKLCYVNLLQGTLHKGTSLINNTNNTSLNIKDLFVQEQSKSSAKNTDICTFTTDKQKNIKRGDILSENKLTKSNEIIALIFIINPEVTNSRMTIKILNQETGCYLHYLSNTTEVTKHSIQKVSIELEHKLVCFPYADNNELGRFILLDENCNTVAAGTIINR